MVRENKKSVKMDRREKSGRSDTVPGGIGKGEGNGRRKHI